MKLHEIHDDVNTPIGYILIHKLMARGVTVIYQDMGTITSLMIRGDKIFVEWVIRGRVGHHADHMTLEQFEAMTLKRIKDEPEEWALI